jgi:hypothetical protein
VVTAAETEKFWLDIGPMGEEELQALAAGHYVLRPKIIERAERSLIYRSPAR